MTYRSTFGNLLRSLAHRIDPVPPAQAGPAGVVSRAEFEAGEREAS